MSNGNQDPLRFLGQEARATVEAAGPQVVEPQVPTPPPPSAAPQDPLEFLGRPPQGDPLGFLGRAAPAAPADTLARQAPPLGAAGGIERTSLVGRTVGIGNVVVEGLKTLVVETARDIGNSVELSLFGFAEAFEPSAVGGGITGGLADVRTLRQQLVRAGLAEPQTDPRRPIVTAEFTEGRAAFLSRRAAEGDPDAQEQLNSALRGTALIASFAPSMRVARLLGPRFRLGSRLSGRVAAFVAGEAVSGAVFGTIRPLEEAETRVGAIGSDAALFAAFGFGINRVARGYRRYLRALPRARKIAVLRRAGELMEEQAAATRAAGESPAALPPANKLEIQVGAVQQAVRELEPNPVDVEAGIVRAAQREIETAPRFDDAIDLTDLVGPGQREITLPDEFIIEQTERFVAPPRIEPLARPSGFEAGAGRPVSELQARLAEIEERFALPEGAPAVLGGTPEQLATRETQLATIAEEQLKAVRLAAGVAEPAVRESEALTAYANRVVSGGAVQEVRLVGSSVEQAAGRDVDLLYDLGELRLPRSSDDAADVVEAALENIPQLDLATYDTFVKVGNRFFHLSSGAGRAIVENTTYAAEQASRPSLTLARNGTKAADEVSAALLEPQAVTTAVPPPRGFEPTTVGAEAGMAGSVETLALSDAAISDAVARLEPLQHMRQDVQNRALAFREAINDPAAINLDPKVRLERAIERALERPSPAAEQGLMLELTGDAVPREIDLAAQIPRQQRDAARRVLSKALRREQAPIEIPPAEQIGASWLDDVAGNATELGPRVDGWHIAARMTDDQLKTFERVVAGEAGFIRVPGGRTLTKVVDAPGTQLFEFNNPTTGLVDRLRVEIVGKDQLRITMIADSPPPDAVLDRIDNELIDIFGERLISVKNEAVQAPHRPIPKGLRGISGAAHQGLLARISLGGFGSVLEAASFSDDLSPGERTTLRTLGGFMLVAAGASAFSKWAKNNQALRKLILAYSPEAVLTGPARAGVRSWSELFGQGSVLAKTQNEMVLKAFPDSKAQRAAMMVLDEGGAAPEWNFLTGEQQVVADQLHKFNLWLGKALKDEGIIDEYVENYVRHILPQETFNRWRTHGFARLPTGGGFTQRRRIMRLRDLEAWAQQQGLPGPRTDVHNVQALHIQEAYRALANKRLRDTFERIGLLQTIRPTDAVIDGWRRVEIAGIGLRTAPDDVAQALEQLAAPRASKDRILQAADTLKSWWMRSIMMWFWEHGLNMLRALPAVSLNPGSWALGVNRAWRAVANGDPLLHELARFGGRPFSRTDYAPLSAKAFEKQLKEAARPGLLQFSKSEILRAGGAFIHWQDRILWDRLAPAISVYSYTTELQRWVKRTGGRFTPNTPEYAAAARKAADFSNRVTGRVATELQNPGLARALRLVLFSPSWSLTRMSISMHAAGELGQVMAGQTKFSDALHLKFKMRQLMAGVAITWALSKAMTGKEPEFNENTLKYYARTGLTDRRGREQGLDMIGWWQDDFKFYNDPLRFFKDRLNPSARSIGDFVEGRDFTGRTVSNIGRVENVLRSFGPPAEAVEFGVRLAQEGTRLSGAEVLRRTSGVLATANVSTLPRPMDVAIAKASRRLLNQVGVPPDDDTVYELSSIMRSNALRGQAIIDQQVINFLAYKKRSLEEHQPLSHLWMQGREVVSDLTR